MEKQLRIIQVVNVRWFNATAWYGLFLSRLLRDAGHQVLVLGLPGTASFQVAADWGLSPVGLPLTSANPVTLASLLRQLSVIIKTFRPHVVNCHRGENFILWGLLRHLGHDFALVRTRGDQRPPKSNIPNKYLHRYAADMLIATNSATALEFSRDLHCREEHIRTILGGVDTDIYRFDPAGRKRVRRECNFQEGNFVVGLLGRLDPVKGVREFLEAMGALCGPDSTVELQQRKNLRVLLAAFPESISEKQVNRWIEKYGLSGRVVLTGKRQDVAACISAMDLGVVASQGSEAIARAALEIMSCGVPLVGTRIGVMPDLLPEWALSSPGEPNELIELIHQGITDTAWRNDLREEALKRMAGLSEQDFLKDTIEAYTAAMRHRHIVT